MSYRKTLSLTFGVLLCFAALSVVATRWCAPVSAFCNHPSQQAQMDLRVDDGVIAVTEVKQLAPRYIEYSPTALQQAQQSGEKVVLYFWAPWCSSCTALDVEIEKNPELIPHGVVVLRVDYDREKELKKRYNIVIQHTFVQVDQAGNVLAEWVGGEPSDLGTMTK